MYMHITHWYQKLLIAIGVAILCIGIILLIGFGIHVASEEAARIDKAYNERQTNLLRECVESGDAFSSCYCVIHSEYFKGFCKK